MTACWAWSEADLLLKEEKAAEDVRSRPFQLPSRRRVLSKAAGTNAGELTTAPAIIVGPDTRCTTRHGPCVRGVSAAWWWSMMIIGLWESSAGSTF